MCFCFLRSNFKGFLLANLLPNLLDFFSFIIIIKYIIVPSVQHLYMFSFLSLVGLDVFMRLVNEFLFLYSDMLTYSPEWFGFCEFHGWILWFLVYFFNFQCVYIHKHSVNFFYFSLFDIEDRIWHMFALFSW